MGEGGERTNLPDGFDSCGDFPAKSQPGFVRGILVGFFKVEFEPALPMEMYEVRDGETVVHEAGARSLVFLFVPYAVLKSRL